MKVCLLHCNALTSSWLWPGSNHHLKVKEMLCVQEITGCCGMHLEEMAVASMYDMSHITALLVVVHEDILHQAKLANRPLT